MGIWPPSNPARILCEPERDFWTFDAATRIAPLARAQATADALAVLARLGGSEVREVELIGRHRYFASSTTHEVATFLSIPATTGPSSCSLLRPDLAETKRAERAAMTLGIADLGARPA
jgi:hypothetical protein